jgi:hypothetical protein
MDDEEKGRLEELEAQTTGLRHVLTRLLEHLTRKDLIDKDTLTAIMSETGSWPAGPECKEAASAVFGVMARSLQAADVIRVPVR